MILIWGKKLYGKVDRSEGQFYVKTEFGHLWYIPLIPTKSWVILEGTEDGEGWRGTPIPMSMKSVLVGWLRAALVLSAIGGAFAAGIAGMEYVEGYGDPMTLAKGIGVFVAPVALYFGLGAVGGSASPERKRALQQHLGMEPDEPVSDQLGYRPLGGGS